MDERTIDLDAMIAGYIECALWSSTYLANEDGNPVSEEGPGTWNVPMDDNFDADDIAQETIVKMTEDCGAFIETNAGLLAEYLEAGQSSEQAGHDFWLTRNGHGAGFWDRGLGDLGDVLTKSSEDMGSFDLYVGDDGKVYGN